MATTKTDAQKVAEYRAIAMDKTKPQEVRDQADIKANEIEKKAAGAAGVKLAKGGVAKKPAAKKMMMGGAVAKDLPMRGQRTATNMAKGGAVKAKKK